MVIITSYCPSHLLTTIFSRTEGSETYITAVFFLMRLIAGVWAYFVCTHHVAGELFAKVVAAPAPSRADHLHHHLFELVWSGPQVIKGAPTSCFNLCICVRVCATCSQVFHSFNGFRGVKWTIQLQKSHTKKGAKVPFWFFYLAPSVDLRIHNKIYSYLN